MVASGSAGALLLALGGLAYYALESWAGLFDQRAPGLAAFIRRFESVLTVGPLTLGALACCGALALGASSLWAKRGDRR